MVLNKRVLAHVIFWLLHSTVGFLAWDLVNYDPTKKGLFIAIVGLSKITTLLYFYLNYSILVPFFLLQRKTTIYIISITLATLLFVLSKAFIWNNFRLINHFFAHQQRSGILFTVVFYFSLSIAFRIYEYWQESENKKNALLQEVKETELLYLKSQMSPHFLFNTLNNIYGLALKNNPKTSLSISQLKDLMLYIETFESVNKISLEQEIHYLKSFIALNQLRYNTSVNFNTKVREPQSLTIEPMLLLPFIENAFKHGSTSAHSNISISLSTDDHNLHFIVINETDMNKRKDNVGGIGIKNVKRRLELLYPQCFKLSAGIKSKNLFQVSITLKLS